MYAVIDIGSNTIRLATFKINGKQLVSMMNKKYSTGLAGYVDKNNNLSQDGINKALEVLQDFEELLKHISHKEVFAFATASLRNVDNSKEVLDYLNSKISFEVKLITGEQEAMYDFYGATRGMRVKEGMMIDVGGGSTELVFFKDNEIKQAISLPIGSLNLYEKYVEKLFPTKKEMLQIEKEVKSKLDEYKLSKDKNTYENLTLVGGTARAVLKLILKSSKDSNMDYTTEQLQKLLDKAQDDSKKIINQIIKTSPDRIHTLIPGLIVINTISKHYKCENVFTSKYGVREGYLQEMLKQTRIELPM